MEAQETFSYKFRSVNDVSTAPATAGSDSNRSRNIYVLYMKRSL
jgi:hypothetical protein